MREEAEPATPNACVHSLQFDLVPVRQPIQLVDAGRAGGLPGVVLCSLCCLLSLLWLLWRHDGNGIRRTLCVRTAAQQSIP